MMTKSGGQTRSPIEVMDKMNDTKGLPYLVQCGICGDLFHWDYNERNNYSPTDSEACNKCLETHCPGCFEVVHSVTKNCGNPHCGYCLPAE